MKSIKSKEMKKYIAHLDKEVKKFRLTKEDISNLYDLFYMVDTPAELRIDIRKTLKMNDMYKWFNEFHSRIEEIVVPELNGCDKKSNE